MRIRVEELRKLGKHTPCIRAERAYQKAHGIFSKDGQAILLSLLFDKSGQFKPAILKDQAAEVYSLMKVSKSVAKKGYCPEYARELGIRALRLMIR